MSNILLSGFLSTGSPADVTHGSQIIYKSTDCAMGLQHTLDVGPRSQDVGRKEFGQVVYEVFEFDQSLLRKSDALK
jgi:hypothetical protein